MGQPRPLFCLFSSFQTNITILKTNQFDKCYVHPWASIHNFNFGNKLAKAFLHWDAVEIFSRVDVISKFGSSIPIYDMLK